MSSDRPARATVRQELRTLLSKEAYSAREIATWLGVDEREVVDHLEHLARSAKGGIRLDVQPARCKECRFVFAKRTRLSRPGRCPNCKSERVEAPRFRVR